MRRRPFAQLYGENIVDTLLEASREAPEEKGSEYQVKEELKMLWPLSSRMYEAYVPQPNLSRIPWRRHQDGAKQQVKKLMK